MIDSVSLRRPLRLLPPSEMVDRGFVPSMSKYDHSPPDREPQKWKLNPPVGVETLPRLTWSSHPKGDWLTAEVSVPKLLFDNNIVQLGDADISRGLYAIAGFVKNMTGVMFDARAALVGRVDYCHNFPVGEANKVSYLSAAARASIPRLTRHHIGDTSLLFQNKSQKVRLYSKHDEVANRANKGRATDDELRASVGLLRLEVSHFTSDACRRLSDRYDLPDRYADLLLNSSIAKMEIERGLSMLGLDEVTETVDARLDVLREVYGDTPHTRRLAGFLGFLDRYGEGFWQHGFGAYSRSTYFEYCRDLKKANVWLRSDRRLPPLRLVRSEAQKDTTRTVQPMSNTVSRSPAWPDSPRAVNG